jgi:hypothetical protein
MVVEQIEELKFKLDYKLQGIGKNFKLKKTTNLTPQNHPTKRIDFHTTRRYDFHPV